MQTKHDVTVTHGWHDSTYLPIQPLELTRIDKSLDCVLILSCG